MLKFERPRVALDFRALADSLPAAVSGLGEVSCPGFPDSSTEAALKAHINRAVQAGRVRRGLAPGEPFDIEADLPEMRRD